MSSDFSYFHCNLCNRWRPRAEWVKLKKPAKVRGYITFGICRDCATRLERRLRDAQRA